MPEGNKTVIENQVTYFKAEPIKMNRLKQITRLWLWYLHLDPCVLHLCLGVVIGPSTAGRWFFLFQLLLLVVTVIPFVRWLNQRTFLDLMILLKGITRLILVPYCIFEPLASPNRRELTGFELCCILSPFSNWLSVLIWGPQKKSIPMGNYLKCMVCHSSLNSYGIHCCLALPPWLFRFNNSHHYLKYL